MVVSASAGTGRPVVLLESRSVASTVSRVLYFVNIGACERRDSDGEGVCFVSMTMELSTLPARRLTVDELIRMAEVGIIDESERVELVDGALVGMSPEGLDHFHVTTTLSNRLTRLYPEGHMIASNTTLPIGEHAYLEPDVFVVDPPSRELTWPAPADVILVVEVARTSVAWDRGGKALAYACWGAETYWVVDLVADEVVVHTSPGVNGYRAVRSHRGDEAIPLPRLVISLTPAEVLRPG
ncbi:MAG: Uma2 family endonuclease [Actinobacteria bacterium]|nr:Uma2 family endonuclease [Actinomycetota bacterium]